LVVGILAEATLAEVAAISAAGISAGWQGGILEALATSAALISMAGLV